MLVTEQPQLKKHDAGGKWMFVGNHGASNRAQMYWAALDGRALRQG